MASTAVVGPYGQLAGSNMGGALADLMGSGDITMGSGPGYQTCKNIYLYHPLGAKIAEKPIEMAQSQKRELSFAGAGTAASKVKEKYEETWGKMGSDNHIFNTMSLSRVYGAAVVALKQKGKSDAAPIDYKSLYNSDYSFVVYDPLNVAGSLVLDQDPLSPNFMHVMNVAVSGHPIHRSRARVMMNENPVYISYTNSAYGYVGRSVYQRALLPLKSFIQTMRTDDLIARKVGVFIAKIKQAGSIINQTARRMLGLKRNVVQEAEADNVISIGTENEDITTIDMTNVAEPYKLARQNILENIASAVPMPAEMLTHETFASGLSEGSEDAKAQARFVDRIREKMQPLYEWFDKICMHLTLTPEFYYTLQAEFPDEFGDVSYEDFFWRVCNSFKAQWPSLLKEPESELVKVDEVKLKAVIAWVEVILPQIPQEERAKVIQWACDSFNDLKLLFGSSLVLDYEAIAEYEAPEPKEFSPPKPFSSQDSVEKFQTGLLKWMEDQERGRRQLRTVK